MKKISLLLTFMALIWFSCTRDTFISTSFDCSEEVTYDTHLRPIIEQSCSLSGCHNGTPGTPGTYTTYQGMLADLERGIFMTRVVDEVSNPSQGMPPDYGPDRVAGAPADLTDEEFMLFSCWLERGFPEN